NGEVSVLIDERDNVLAIPNDAIKSPREAVATGAMLGMSADSVTAELRAQGFSGGGGNRGGFGGGNRGGRRNGGGNGNGGGAAPGTGAASAAAGGAKGSANGDIGFAQQGQQGFGQQGGFGQQVSDADCKKIDDVLKAHPKEKKQIDSLRAKLAALRPAGFNRQNGGSNRNGGSGNGGSGGGADRQRGANRSDSAGGRQRGAGGGGGGFRGSPEMQAVNEQLRAIYTALNIDPRTAGSCARRQQGAAQSSNAGASTRGQGTRSLSPSPESGGPQRTRTGLVFVTDSSKTQFAPRIVQLGQSNLDFTEVVSGLKEGERVVMLGALALQAQRLQQQDRIRQNASPLGGQPGPGAGRGPGGGGRGGRG